MIDEYKHWLTEIEREDRLHKKYRNLAEEVEEKYYDEQEKAQAFNIFWSNTQVLQSALLSNTPKPDVRRRFLSESKDERDIAEVLERALSYSIDQYNFKGVLDSAVQDDLVPGLGVVRIHYKPYFDFIKREIDLEPKEGIGEDGQATIRYYNDNEEIAHEKVRFRDVTDPASAFIFEAEEEKVFEETYESHIPWNHFHWQPAQKWNQVGWCAIDHILDRQSLVEQFGKDIGHKIPLLYSEKGQQVEKEKKGTHALVYEVFDKRARKYRFLSPGMDDFIDVVDDPLGLEGFYPFPEPLMENVKSGELVPMPEYLFYQSQAMELERVTQRLDKLTNQLRYRGVYDNSFPEMGSVMDLQDGQIQPIDDFSGKLPDKSLRDIVTFMPLEEAANVITMLEQRREQIKQTIFEIIGISDIIRGVSKASETLGAQQIKKQFAGLRIAQRQQRVERFIRDIFRIKSEIMAEHFDAETLTAMTGIEVTPDMQKIMQDDMLRNYKIDVETDSTVFQDAQEEQKNRIEVLSAITQFIQQAFPAVQSGLLPIEIAKEMVLFGIRSFKSGRQLEDAIEEIGNQGDSQAGPGADPLGQLGAGNGVPQGLNDPSGGAGGAANLPDGVVQLLGG